MTPKVKESAYRVARRFARQFPSQKALNSYLSEHPNADARAHEVAKPKEDDSDEEKSLKDLQSRAKHMKKQKPEAIKVDPETEKSLKDLKSRAKRNK